MGDRAPDAEAVTDLEALLAEARACTLCAAHLPLGPRPVLVATHAARLLIIGQAPGTKVHETGIPWNDASGDRLRHWLGIGRDTFYGDPRIAIVPMGFCYPGRQPRGGDNPPRPECAPAWHRRLLAAPPWTYGVALCGVAGALLYGVLMLDRIGLAGALGLALVAAVGVAAAGILVYRLIDRQGRDDRADILFAAMQRFPEARIVTAEDGGVIFANAAYRALAGNSSEATGASGVSGAKGIAELAALFGDDQMARAKLRRLEANALDGLSVQDVLGYRPAGGRQRLLGVSAHPFEELEDHVVWALSDAGRPEDGAGQAQLAEFVDGLPLGLYTADAEGRFTLVNRVLGESLGVAPEELVAAGSRLEDFLAAMPTATPMTMPENVREVRLKDSRGAVFPAA